MAFLLQGGFMEGVQLRCGEAYLKILAGKLGCTYMGKEIFFNQSSFVGC